jgi:hypothetical protein
MQIQFILMIHFADTYKSYANIVNRSYTPDLDDSSSTPYTELYKEICHSVRTTTCPQISDTTTYSIHVHILCIFQL